MHRNWTNLRFVFKIKFINHKVQVVSLSIHIINVSPMNSCVKLVAAWSVPLDRYEREQAKMASHWQFLFLRERWSRRATVVGEDLEQVTSNCLPGSGQVSSGWMEGIEDHAGYRYLRIRIVTSLRATGSLPPKRGALVIWTSFDSRARGLINPLRSDLSFFLPHFLSNFPTRVSLPLETKS